MDPINPGPEAYGQDGDDSAPRQRPPRESLTSDFGQSTPAPARIVQLISGENLLTVNPIDGSEIETCPPAARPGRPAKLTAEQRAETERAARPATPPGPAQLALPLLERQDVREDLVRLLARGRSVRLTGPSGSGRTRVLDTVADDCQDLAPDGVVRLSGFRRSADDLLHDLFRAVFDAPRHRPERDELLDLVREIGAVVVLDDLEFGGAALDELLDATPECAFLLSATPEVPAPSADSAVEEIELGGLDRAGGVDLLEHAVSRSLTEEEANWAGDLWFESEGLPLRFVQAGALLRQRDQLRASTSAVDEFGVFAEELPVEDSLDPDDGEELPLPSLGEAAAPARLLASRLSLSARAALRFAVALGGEVPHQAHLPALVGDTHADAALGELAACGLVTQVGARHRLATGVLTQLEAAGYADDLPEQALAAAQHYTWWAGHPSVTPERVCREADAVLAALAVLVPRSTPPAEGEESPAVQLARITAPAFAAGLDWSAWEQTLHAGAEASERAEDVQGQSYFHHEMGILALCDGLLDRARAELETSIGLRGALTDKRGTVAGRRALALVADRSGITIGLAALMGDEISDARNEESASPPRGIPAGAALGGTALHPPGMDASTLVTYGAPQQPEGGSGGFRRLARRNLVAAGSGALLVAVLGTVVTLGMTSHDSADDTPTDRVGLNPSASQGVDDGSLGAASPKKAKKGDTGTATSRPTDPGPDGTYGTSDDPTPAATTGPTDEPTGGKSTKPGKSSSPSKSSSPKPTKSTSSPKPTKSTSSPNPSTSTSTSPDPTDTATDSPPPATTSTTASGPASSAPAASSSAASVPASGGAVSPSDGTVI
ncbi:ATP-binding protein [Streptomyces mangrovisoli]|uniref:AAA family ATPase n=1 Tax=Streptomyces mangrovisoli TaxID=1428628 RepID=A0A1J4P0C3_9ACTN|nr:ATP-binding protein [Streptomyces mangrovisoli]OIJ67722.1 AAA family ATPase [Streptomyces mangrovisoli]